MAVMVIYATAADAAEAERIGRAVVSERLAACANILPGARSIYWWQGKIDEASEAVLILKTTRERLAALDREGESAPLLRLPLHRRARGRRRQSRVPGLGRARGGALMVWD